MKPLFVTNRQAVCRVFYTEFTDEFFVLSRFIVVFNLVKYR
jgi:hypothetical protein